MKQILLFFFMFCLFNTSHGQSMSSLFKNLPLDCTPDLSYKERDSLLSNKNYTIPGGDSLETTIYSIDTSQIDYLRYEFTFTTGQSGFIVFELRRFKKENGKTFIVFSRCGGLAHSFFQRELRIFDIINSSLKENKTQTLLPQVVEIQTLLNVKTPADVKKKIKESINSSYYLDPSIEDQIKWNITFNYEYENEKWLIGNSVLFKWNGNTFDKKITKE